MAERTWFNWKQFWLDQIWPLPLVVLIIRAAPRLLWEAEKAYWRKLRADYATEEAKHV